MCLAIPMKVLDVHGLVALCDASGIQRTVSLWMLPPDSIMPGDFILVHVGYAIQKMHPADALSTWELVDRMRMLEEGKQGA